MQLSRLNSASSRQHPFSRARTTSLSGGNTACAIQQGLQ
jgi:hypothetical protein